MADEEPTIVQVVLWPVRKAIYYFSNHSVSFVGSPGAGKSMFIGQLEEDSDYMMETTPTKSAADKSQKIYVTGDEDRTYFLKYIDVGGEEGYWLDWVKGFVRFRPPIIMFLLHGFSVNPHGAKTEPVVTEYHLSRHQYRTMEKGGISRWDENPKYWVHLADRAAFNFFKTVILFPSSVPKLYPDLYNQAPLIFNKLIHRPYRPKEIWFVVNALDLKFPSESKEAWISRIMKPYMEDIKWFTKTSGKKIKIRMRAVSAKKNLEMDEIRTKIRKDRKWRC